MLLKHRQTTNNYLTSLAINIEGETEIFGPRILPSGEVIRQSYIGPMRPPVGVRSQIPVGMSPHGGSGGMPPPQFAIQHRAVAGYTELQHQEVTACFWIFREKICFFFCFYQKRRRHIA